MTIPSLATLVEIAKRIGARPDYVQGGGGNVSLKLPEGVMAVKASGLRLDALDEKHGFVTIAHQKLREFFHRDELVTLDLPTLIEKNEAAVQAQLVAREGRAFARPSIETGFHAILGEVVLHTHSVYVNLLMCSTEGTAILHELFPEARFIPYNTPGIALTLAILHAESTQGNDLLFLENHGLVIVAPTPEAAYAEHERVNERIRAHFGLNDPYPTLCVAASPVGWQSESLFLTGALREQPALATLLTEHILFPDQAVYTGDNVSLNPEEPKSVTIHAAEGSIRYRGSKNEALAFEETFAAWLYLITTIDKLGLTRKTLPSVEALFIANLESEKYRKSLL